jgi:hypothetical protein
MKLKGIKRGNTIELIDQIIDIPDGTEITLTIAEQTTVTPEDYLARLQACFAEPASEDLIEALATVEHERQLSLELTRLNLQLQTTADNTPLTSLIGSAPGSFATPDDADQFIRQERDTWDY